MTRTELVESIAASRGLSHKQSEELVITLFGTIAEALKNGERVDIRGFGNFIVKEYRPYLGRNPKTGEFIQVHPKKLPFFKTSSLLKERLAR